MLGRRQFGRIMLVNAAQRLVAAGGKRLLFVGTYTQGDSRGIYTCHFDPQTGKIVETGLAAEVTNPSFLYISRDRERLYAVNEDAIGQVTAFRLEPGGRLTKINQQPTGGDAPCHLTADPSGRFILIAQYNSGSVAVLPILADGSLGERTQLLQHQGSSVDSLRQEGPHAHFVTFSPKGTYAVVIDLGTDELIVYKLDTASGTLHRHSAVKVKAGSGPRHLAFHPDGRFAYCDYEMTGEVATFEWDETAGKITHMETLSTLPAGYDGPRSCAEIAVHPSGKFLYVSNRGHDSVAMYAIGEGRRLKLQGTIPTEGKTPRNFVIDPSGEWLLAANQDGGNIVVFRIDLATGVLRSHGEQAKIPFPVCLRFI